MDIKELVNKGIGDLSPYEPGKPIEDLERELGPIQRYLFLRK